jgi:hypothetical protein
MRADLVIQIRIDGQDIEALQGRLAEILPPGRLGAGGYEVRFRKGDQAAAELTSELRRMGVGWREIEERAFRPRELAEAAALRISPGAEAPHVAVEHAFQGACHGCGRGGEQVEDLVVTDSDPAPRGFSLSRQGVLLVSELVARALVRERISGLLLRRTRDGSGRVAGLFQVLPTHTLPPLRVPPTRIEHRPEAGCPACGRGSLDIVSLLYFDLDPCGFCDLNLTREVSATGRVESGLVVSQRLLRLLFELEAAPAAAEPVVLV